MKTPREIILEKHQAAESRLRAIRAEDLAAHARTSECGVQGAECGVRLPYPGMNSKGMSWLRDFWRESVWPWRRAWIAMVSLWVVILVANFAGRETLKMASASAAQLNPEVIKALHDRKQLMAQLLDTAETPAAMPQRKQGPRSEREQRVIYV